MSDISSRRLKVVFRYYAKIILWLWVAFLPEEGDFSFSFPQKKKVQTSSGLKPWEIKSRSLCLREFLGFTVADDVKSGREGVLIL